jgi:hypothetical protein
MPRPRTTSHGTKAGVQRHQRDGESLAKATTVCPACTAKLAELNAANYLKRKAQKPGRPPPTRLREDVLT